MAGESVKFDWLEYLALILFTVGSMAFSAYYSFSEKAKPKV